MFRKLLSYLGTYKKAAILAIFCVTTEVAFELIIPFIMADILDIGVATGNREYIISRGVLMLICSLIALGLGIGSAYFSALAGQGLGAELRKAEYRKIQSFSFANTDKFRTSSLITRLTSDITTIQTSFSTGLRPACRAPIMMIMALGLSVYINWKLALVFFIGAPTLGLLLFFIIRKVRPLYASMQGAIDLVNRVIQENLTAVRVVKAYVRGDYEMQKFYEVNQNWRGISEKAFRLASMNMAAMQLVMYTTILCILWFGGQMILGGTMQVGELTGFLSYVLQVLNSLMMISNVFLMLTRSLTSGKRIMEVMEEKVTLTDDDAQDIKVERGEIVFDHVSFKYKEKAKEKVLSDISFYIKAGQTVGIIGQTGAAKSTLVQLIPRLYDATEGQIYIDGKPIQHYPLKHLRDSIAMVLQKNTLFSGTVKENLRWGKEDATEKEIEEACAIACVDEFIDRLKDGYDTELGQGGVNVSGGQKQRLCIARAILKRPKVLILDDSTSAVDTATEGKIREGLAKTLADTTKIIIAQRITSVLHADQIIILDDGKINAIGDHETLLKSNEIYQDIYYSQQEGAGL